MKALTVWQPWASLIIGGWKPYEYRRWPAPASIVGQRIVIHAAARPPRTLELHAAMESWNRIDGNDGRPLDGRDIAGGAALLQRLWEAPPERVMPVSPIWHGNVPGVAFGAGIGTAIVGRAQRVSEIFLTRALDPHDLDPDIWAWPLTDIEPFAQPVPMRGAQGLWRWPEAGI
jgi:hypothetical protein